MKTLVIVDVQNDFMPGGPLAIAAGDTIVPVINRLMGQFDLVVATQDWHPADHKSFASNHPGGTSFSQIILNGLDQTLWPDHCVQETLGAAFYPDLETNKVEAIFRKGMDREIDSYSGFYDNRRRKNTGLAGYLRERGATELFFCGLAGDICVYYSLKDALQAGFATSLISDAALPLSEAAYEKAKADILRLGGRVIDSEEIG
jgi:nicotinamidase/pyrazinamidase